MSEAVNEPPEPEGPENTVNLGPLRLAFRVARAYCAVSITVPSMSIGSLPMGLSGIDTTIRIMVQPEYLLELRTKINRAIDMLRAQR